MIFETMQGPVTVRVADVMFAYADKRPVTSEDRDFYPVWLRLRGGDHVSLQFPTAEEAREAVLAIGRLIAEDELAVLPRATTAPQPGPAPESSGRPPHWL